MKKNIFISYVNLLLANILILFLFSCNRLESPEFLSVDNVTVKKTGISGIKLMAEATFHNPNTRDLILKKANIDVYYNDKFITNYNRDYNIKIEKNANFMVPVEVDLSLKDLDMNMLSSAINMFMGKKQEIGYKGHIRVKAFGIGIRVPVDGKSTLNIR